MRPRCSILTGGFDFSGCGDFTSCPPVERAEMSNSEPSAIVLQAIPCIGGLYISFDSNGEIGSLKVHRDHLSRSRMRSRTGLPTPERTRLGQILACNVSVGSCSRGVGDGGGYIAMTR